MIMRIVVIFLLCVVGLVGLGMSLCGGAITLSGLTEAGHHGELRASDMMVISVPSLVIGLLIVGIVIRSLRRRLSQAPDAARQEIDETR